MGPKAPGSIGRQAEQRCRRFLEARGLVIIAGNYRGPRGELDLIAREGDCTVFVEVRFRQRRHYGEGLETVDRHKRARLVATAWHYLQRHPRSARGPCRFDVVSIGGDEQIRWIKNAFGLED